MDNPSDVNQILCFFFMFFWSTPMFIVIYWRHDSKTMALKSRSNMYVYIIYLCMIKDG